MDEFTIIIEEPADEGIRIDKFLAANIPEKSRSYYQKSIDNGFVLVNGKQVKSKYQTKLGDEIIVSFEPVKEIDIIPEDIPIEILYEDDDVIVVNKPKGMVVHPAPGHYSGTLVNALMYHCKESLSGINGEIRPGIVHRIDMNTTGSLLVCKNDKAHNDIAAQIKVHSVNRIYKGIVIGNFKDETGTVDAPIGRNPKDRKKMAVVSGGREAVTHFTVLEQFKGYSYVQFKLETGRTHQIRVHMASIGHPLLGDDVYGKPVKGLEGQTLHAQTLGFIQPTSGEYVEVNAPLPVYFEKLLEKYRKMNK
ncbi:23S rRNA pseudouridine1911/1915/1917 synthase [Pseudobutyrivibrio sp. ACV-2]|uniref:RluA family pseudouridine synthase n=1 Tax=Pseudobutyrivibrio sp. ACV-2 TaxID=1520801 RepID=UPI00089B8AC2|nr:RluA family pseudouridine synthase [Pseudobutyrivibrio sp. ACV-2]SDZ81885.1 23S rRNA pseudouridine1911/1915/1917 synthase [Pseudobutyrivibrio sp. ACV-2]